MAITLDYIIKNNNNNKINRHIIIYDYLLRFQPLNHYENGQSIPCSRNS